MIKGKKKREDGRTEIRIREGWKEGWMSERNVRRRNKKRQREEGKE